MALRSLVLITCLALPLTGLAKPSLKATIGEGFAVGLPPLTFMGVGVSVPLPRNFGWYVEGAFGTPNTTLAPMPRLIAGPSYRFKELSVGVTAFYQWNPDYNGKGNGHVVGATAFIARPVSDKASIALLVGPWFFAFGPKFSFTIF
jgi:hypothetical protein